MRVLFVARYLQAINQKKVLFLCQQPGLQLWHLVPTHWHDAFNRYQAASQSKDHYEQIAHPVVNAPDIHRFVYWPVPRFIRDLRPDVIHVEEEPESLAALEFSLLRRLLAPRAKLILFTWQNIQRRTNAVVDMIRRVNLRSADGLIGGNTDALSVARTLGFRGPAIVLPQLGLDPEDFSPKPREAQRAHYQLDGFTVGYVGRLTQEKGLATLLNAIQPLADIRLMMVGNGPMLASLQEAKSDPRWGSRLIVTGSLSHVETAQVISAFDALVLPSFTRQHWKEQFGHVLIEAMACGVPVIGSASGAIPEVIGDAGLLFPEGNTATLQNCLLRLQADSQLRATLRARGHERVLARYTHQHIAEQTAAFYQQVLSHRQ